MAFTLCYFSMIMNNTLRAMNAMPMLRADIKINILLFTLTKDKLTVYINTGILLQDTILFKSLVS